MMKMSKSQMLACVMMVVVIMSGIVGAIDVKMPLEVQPPELDSDVLEWLSANREKFEEFAEGLDPKNPNSLKEVADCIWKQWKKQDPYSVKGRLVIEYLPILDDDSYAGSSIVYFQD